MRVILKSLFINSQWVSTSRILCVIFLLNNMTSNGRKSNVLCLYIGPLNDKICLDCPVFKSGTYKFVSLREKLERYVTDGSFDFKGAAEMCFRFMQQSEIDVVIALDDFTTPILSLLVERQVYKGPSLESLFLTINKFYTRAVIDTNPVPFCHVDMGSFISQKKLEQLLSEVGLPAILKPVNGFWGSLVQKVHSVHEMSMAISLMQKNRLPIFTDYKPLFSECVDLTKFPLALKEGLIVETFVDGIILDLDGYVLNKEVYPWAIYEGFNYKSHPEVLQMLVMPCMVTDEVQARAWQMFHELSKRLIEHGFNNQFVNIQLFLCKNGDIRLLEINGRMSSCCIPMCRRSLTPGDSLEALMRVASGVKPQTPRLTGVHSAFVELQCMISGKASDIIDFKAAKSMENIILFVTSDEYIDTDNAEIVKLIGVAYLFAGSREEILRQVDQLYDKLFKRNPLG